MPKKSSFQNELKTEYILATRVVCAENAECAERLLDDRPAQAVLCDENLCRIEKGGFVLLDFGEEMRGGLKITIDRHPYGAGRLHVVFGESVSEALSKLGEKNSTNDHAPRDIIIDAPQWGSFAVGDTGFRFVRIEAVDAALVLRGVLAVSLYCDLPQRGGFDCSDPLLSRIWRVGAKTVHLNMQEYLWDGIKRDRLVWVGDMHPELATILSVFGSCKIVPKTLDFIRIHTPANGWANDLPSYSLWLLVILRDWYIYTGDEEYLRKNADCIYEIIKLVLEHLAPDGSDTFGDKFIDWETKGLADVQYGFRAMLVLGLRAGARLCGVLGNEALACRALEAVRVLASLSMGEIRNKQIAALLVMAGLLDAKQTNEKILKTEPLRGLSAFLGYYTLQARALAGDVAGSLDMIRGFWGRMLELGATTFWESFDALWARDAIGIDQIVPAGAKDMHGDYGDYCYRQHRCSLCHGWAAGPTPFLSKYVLGVHILEPGCRKILVKPELAGLDWVRGIYPTPFGTVKITAENKGGRTDVEIEAPKETEVIVGQEEKCE